MARMYKKGDRVRVIFKTTEFTGLLGTVTNDEQRGHAIEVRMDKGNYTRWLGTSLELVEATDSQPMQLTPGQIRVYNAAHKLREAQIEFQNAL